MVMSARLLVDQLAAAIFIATPVGAVTRVVAGRSPGEDGAGQLAGVSRSRRIMICEVLIDHILATGTLLTTRQPSAA